MSKVLIDRELLERAVYRLELAYDADAPIVCDLSSVLAAPSGTPAMPVKAYYHESPNEYGGLNKSVGLEVRKQFNDAPLVLESDALAQIARLEGEIAKRDARIVELENELSDIDFARRVSLQNESDLAETLNLLRAELASLKAQEPVAEVKHGPLDSSGWPEFVWVETIGDFDLENLPNGMKLYAYPVSEAKAQGVVMPTVDQAMRVVLREMGSSKHIRGTSNWCADVGRAVLDEVARLNAAPVQQVSVPASAFASRAITHYEAALLAAFPSGSSGEVSNQWNEARRVLTAAPSPAGVDGEHEAQPEVAENTGSRSMANKLQSQGCTGRTEVDGVAAPDEASDAVDIYAWSTFDGEGGYDLRLYENNETYQAEWLALNGEKYSGWVKPLCRLSDATAIIDGLRGEVAAIKEQSETRWAAYVRESNIRREIEQQLDQQAQRIGELEGLLREVHGWIDESARVYRHNSTSVMLYRIDAALSAGNEPKQCT